MSHRLLIANLNTIAVIKTNSWLAKKSNVLTIKRIMNNNAIQL